jgi:hypothetical protein
VKVRPFLHSGGGASTLDQLEWLIEQVQPEQALFCFAYVTLSGCAEFNRRVGGAFWEGVSSRWLTAFDYGRTEPSALTFLDAKPNSAVAIHDGAAVLASGSLIPRRDFHIKTCFLTNATQGTWGMLAGSGNFSRNGLSNSVEGGVAVTARAEAEYTSVLRPSFRRAEALWAAGEAAGLLLPAYTALFTPPEPAPRPPDAPPKQPYEFGRFWIDVGYVTRNRGLAAPGNQIDMPRGVHRFFGFEAGDDIPRNTVIGDVVFRVASGPIARSLRLGNNLMEKITLPIPEDHGFGAYDGKILEFVRVPGGFELGVYELDAFDRSLRGSSGATYEMGSGRLYGFRD